jgi:NADH-quinone oxidoreductase subunit N
MNLQLNYLASFSYIIPEVLSLVLMTGLILLEATFKLSERSRDLLKYFTYAGLLIVFGSLVTNFSVPATRVFTNAYTIDSFGTFIKLIMVIGALFCIRMAFLSRDISDHHKNEYSILVLGLLIGGMLLVSANNLLVFYIGIETLSIISYAMAALKRKDHKSSEAGLKYSLYGGVTAGIMLFGMSHIYGVLGTIDYAEIYAGLKNISNTDLVILLPSFLLFFAGIGYKIACVPFHMWSPDVYEGSPLPVTAIFSILPKVAGMGALYRLVDTFFTNNESLMISWNGILLVIAALTMTVGNVTAIGQRSVKRMLAYSSISHSGFMMLGALAIDQSGTSSMLFYIANYLFMTLVAFYIVGHVSDHFDNDHFDRFSGLIKHYPVMTIVLAITMFSLAGIPPFGGFVAKFNIISTLLNKGFYTIALVAVLNSVVSLYYYLKIVRLSIFKESNDDLIEGFSLKNQLVIGFLALPIVILGLYWDSLLKLVKSGSLLHF